MGWRGGGGPEAQRLLQRRATHQARRAGLLTPIRPHQCSLRSASGSTLEPPTHLAHAEQAAVRVLHQLRGRGSIGLLDVPNQRGVHKLGSVGRAGHKGELPARDSRRRAVAGVASDAAIPASVSRRTAAGQLNGQARAVPGREDWHRQRPPGGTGHRCGSPAWPAAPPASASAARSLPWRRRIRGCRCRAGGVAETALNRAGGKR